MSIPLADTPNFLLTNMPGGSSFIYGVFPCSEPRYIFDSKPRTITVDAEVYLGRDAHEKVNVLNAVVHYYVPSGETPPRGADYYLIGGRVASVADDTPVGEGYSTKDYDVEIEAIFVSNFVLDGLLTMTLIVCHSYMSCRVRLQQCVL